jgi:Protein of unknown function (DUF1571)
MREKMTHGRAGVLAALGLGIAILGTGMLALPSGAGVSSTDEALRLLELAEEGYAEVQDYTTVLLARERVGGTLNPRHAILLKFGRPFSVYMRWMDGPFQGREGLFVEGAWGDRFLVQEKQGVARFVTAAMSPNHPRIFQFGRHPVTDIGIGHLLQILGQDARRAARNGVLAVNDRGVQSVAGRPAHEVEGILPSDPDAGYYCHRVVVSFDLENHLPVRAVVYDWADQLVEEYTYTDLRLNPGLTNRDFDPENPAYGFSRLRIPLG